MRDIFRSRTLRRAVFPRRKRFAFMWHRCNRPRVSSGESERLRNEIRLLDTIGARVERSSYLLMELSRNVGIAAAIPALSQELDRIELVPLSDNRVLMILATRDRMVRNRVVTLDEPASPDELASIRNYVNRNFTGWQLGAARRELLRRMLEDRELIRRGAAQTADALSQGIAGRRHVARSTHGRRLQPAWAGSASDPREAARSAARARREAAADGDCWTDSWNSRRASWRCVWVWKKRIRP